MEARIREGASQKAEFGREPLIHIPFHLSNSENQLDPMHLSRILLTNK